MNGGPAVPPTRTDPRAPWGAGPRRLARRAALWTLSATLLLGLSDGGWVLLQGVAWARMIVDYSRTQPLWQALEDTFDGRHPCPLCKTIRKSREASREREQAPVPQPPAPREAILTETSTCHPDGSWSWYAATAPRPGTSWEKPPLKPPPRAGAHAA